MDHLFFNGWEPLLRILIVGICSYIALIALLRAAGKRTLSRMNSYDMVVTMALGSIMAKVLLTQEVSISESIAAMLLLIGLQYIVSVAMWHFPSIRCLVSSPPAVLFYQGSYQEKTLRRERVDKEEIRAALHEKGAGDLALVEAVILGANGQLSVIFKPEYWRNVPVSDRVGN